MSLTIPLITWMAVVILTALIAIVHVIHHAHRRHIFGMGTEREELFVPGDPLPTNEEDYDDGIE